MKKIIILLLVFIASFLFLAIFTPSFAQDGAEETQRWVCLGAKDFAKTKHFKMLLSTKPEAMPLANAETYIVECVDTDKGVRCTTGVAETDVAIWGKNNLAVIQRIIPEYTFDGIFQEDGTTPAENPAMSGTTGDVGPFVWASTGPRHRMGRRWYAMNFYDPQQANQEEEQCGADTTSQKQCSLTFQQALESGDCKTVRWDPYGRVFDAQSLEPIPDVKVTLLMKRENGEFTKVTGSDSVATGGIKNPEKTDADGKFSFVVDDGTYKLQTDNFNYDFVPYPPNLHTNYKLAYSDIYTGDEVVQIGGNQEHRDIPLTSKTGPQRFEVVLMRYFEDLNKTTNTLFVEGTVSHPLTKINIYSQKVGSAGNPVRFNLLNSISADKNGIFNFYINQSTFQPDESCCELELIKVDLTKVISRKDSIKNVLVKVLDKLQIYLSFLTRVEAQEGRSFNIEPILNYVEGFAYDEGKATLVNAKVGVYLDFSDKPLYETTTDETGYFKITSEYLPTMPFGLRYTTTDGKKLNVSTSAFIAQNSDYLIRENIDLNDFKNARGEKPTFKSEETITPPANVTVPPAPIVKGENTVLKTVVILLLLTFGVLAVGYWYFRKKSQLPPSA